MTGTVVGMGWWSQRRMQRDGVAYPAWAASAVAFGTVLLWGAGWLAATLDDGAGAGPDMLADASGELALAAAVIGAAALFVGTAVWHSLHAVVRMIAAGWALALVAAGYLLLIAAPGFELEPGACFNGMDCIGYSSPQYEVTVMSLLFFPLSAPLAMLQLVALVAASAVRAGRRHRHWVG